MSWNDTGTRLISGSDDCHLSVYDLATGLVRIYSACPVEWACTPIDMYIHADFVHVWSMHVCIQLYVHVYVRTL